MTSGTVAATAGSPGVRAPGVVATPGRARMPGRTGPMDAAAGGPILPKIPGNSLIAGSAYPNVQRPLRFAGPEDIDAPGPEEDTGYANWRRQALPWGVVKDKEIQLPLEAPSWLNSGDTAWQLTAATLVGLMSVPGLAVLYGGVMQKRWSINSMMLTFATFSIVLVVWVLWAFKMGFGTPWHGLSHSGFLGNFIGKPGPVLSHTELQHQASIPLIGTMSFPKSALVYFQFVFAAITPILALGSVLGRVNFKAWIPFCLLWITCVYAVDAFLLWGGGFFAQHGAVDFSGGYVIHLSAGVAGFVAAAVIGPRLQRDRGAQVGVEHRRGR